MKQIELTKPTTLLDKRGHLISPGYSTRMWHEYDSQKAKSFPFRLKEWDFYQFHLGEWVLQLTIGHISYGTQISANLFSLETGTKYSFDRLYILDKKSLLWSSSPETPNILELREKDYYIKFDCGVDYKHFILQVDNNTQSIDIDLHMPWNPSQEKMIIATPFEKRHQFYLNCKEHYYDVKGHIRFNNQNILVNGDKTGLLDWGRGVWPYHQEWFWGCGGDYQNNGRFGFNIGWGFGDTSRATENMFFWNEKAYKLGELQVERNLENYMEPWHFYTENGTFDVVMTPIYDNYTETKIAIVNNHCHQVFGKYNGFAKLPDDTIIRITDMIAFCEHAVNNW